MERLRLALRVVIGQACETAAAIQGMGLGCGMSPPAPFQVRGAFSPYYNGKMAKRIRPVKTNFEDS
jgi:hypothetical protein